MSALLRFPRPDDARVAADLRSLCADFQVGPERTTAVLSRFLRTVAAGRSSAVATMEARRILHDRAEPAPRGAA